MAGKLPKPQKPAEALRRRNAPESWTVLPSEGCKLPVPAWPAGKASASEAALWKRLWASPVACWWHDQKIEPDIVARYVALRFEKPGLAVVARLESELGLTPMSLLRMRLVVEEPESEPEQGPDPYAHLKRELGG
jgi:hypothetical protein